MSAPGAIAARTPERQATCGEFRVVIVSPEGYPHSAAFSELAETVVYGLQALGFDAQLVVNNLASREAPTVIFGANLLGEQDADQLPESTIVYNLEQVSGTNVWCSPVYMALLSRCQVWDYSRRNITSLAALGVTSRAVHVPVGYMPQLARIPWDATQDIDVLFYGSLNDRRRKIIQALTDTGLRTHAVFGVYGSDRDALIARAKVVLNLHYYETSIFELVRVSYLLANHKAVVAERHEGTEIDPDLADAVKFSRYEELVSACAELVADAGKREALAARGLSCMSSRDERVILARAMSLPQPWPGAALATSPRAEPLQPQPAQPCPLP
jgi:hypothetical protein